MRRPNRSLVISFISRRTTTSNQAAGCLQKLALYNIVPPLLSFVSLSQYSTGQGFPLRSFVVISGDVGRDSHSHLVMVVSLSLFVKGQSKTRKHVCLSV